MKASVMYGILMCSGLYWGEDGGLGDGKTVRIVKLCLCCRNAHTVWKV